jgi:hypothetical protein
MNPTTKIIFIQKIIGYGLPKIDKPFQIKKYFKVNSEWSETIIDYIDHILSKKDINGDTNWHYLIRYLDCEDVFWEKIIRRSDEWFVNNWNQKNNSNCNVWFYAVQTVKSAIFWKFIENKPNKWYVRMDWYDNNNYGKNVWDVLYNADNTVPSKLPSMAKQKHFMRML